MNDCVLGIHVAMMVCAVQCTADRCAAVGVGARSRDTVCVAFNGSLVDSSQCDDDTRPDHVDDCQHNDCVTTWTASTWSQVLRAAQYHYTT